MFELKFASPSVPAVSPFLMATTLLAKGRRTIISFSHSEYGGCSPRSVLHLCFPNWQEMVCSGSWSRFFKRAYCLRRKHLPPSASLD
ncbi:hypothetical protein MANES_15G169701v8 [Manihot esculenta]|uniref:Uncharacterized protein n=1 Tax=Manihot esculenta TaxID=3983 RepID=A0ACB7GC91_MANES|nr:hypothetical protein MANES_15G169701v8 [Manihot esculenta]